MTVEAPLLREDVQHRQALDREVLDRALRQAKAAAFGRGEFVGQESFVSAGQVVRLATAAGVGPRTTVLDLCCGVGGPGALVARRLGCSYLGVDASAGAVEVARARAHRRCRFEQGTIPPVLHEPADVVLLLETVLAFPDKQGLFSGVAKALRPGGRFAFTVEVGQPLTAAERDLMPAADTVWPVPCGQLRGGLADAGLTVRWWEDWTSSHATTVASLERAYTADCRRITAALGEPSFDDLLTSHRLWTSWLRSGRVRKLALVAQGPVGGVA
ncbi:MAG TPA: class I SAM-dependent methyltransferase [Pedococcus sp.]